MTQSIESLDVQFFEFGDFCKMNLSGDAVKDLSGIFKTVVERCMQSTHRCLLIDVSDFNFQNMHDSDRCGWGIQFSEIFIKNIPVKLVC